MRKNTALFLLAMMRCVVASGAAAEAPAPYVLPNTEVRQIHSAVLNRDYELYVSLPKSYATGRQHYPLVFVTDAPYAFPVAASIGPFIARHSKGMPEFILIGLSYAKGDTAEFSRRRDYTPSRNGGPGLSSDMPGRKPVFGEAEAYRRFLKDEVFALIAAHYRADMAHKVLAGHSYGSLFGAYVLLTDPAMFDGYVLGSPSLWYDDRLLFQRERKFAQENKNLSATVYLAAGAFEGAAPNHRAGDKRYSQEGRIVNDTLAFAHALASRRYPGLRLKSEIIADENHLTVAPVLLTRGLLWTLSKPTP